jgi:predicted nucleic acid-binding protein
MARETFVDTSGFYALLVGKDDMHDKAARILSDAQRRGRLFVTTDYVLDETITLLCARGHQRLVEPFLQSTLRSEACSVEWTDPEVFSQSATFLIKHIDQGWSFTDCVSFRIMRSRRLRDALTKDVHFEKAGFTALLR